MVIEHIGIAVRDAEKWKSMYCALFPNALYKEEIVPSQGVKVLFVEADNVKIELLEPLNEESTVYRFLEKKGEGFHHIAYLVENIKETMDIYKENGYQFLYETPSIGAEKFLINFLSPKTTRGMLTEFCQKP